MESEDPKNEQGAEDSQPEHNVVRFPRDWLGETNELVPFGSEEDPTSVGGPTPRAEGAEPESEEPADPRESEAGSAPDSGAGSAPGLGAASAPDSEAASVSDSGAPAAPDPGGSLFDFVPAPPPRAEDFWGEGAADIHHALQAPEPAAPPSEVRGGRKRAPRWGPLAAAHLRRPHLRVPRPHLRVPRPQLRLSRPGATLAAVRMRFPGREALSRRADSLRQVSLTAPGGSGRRRVVGAVAGLGLMAILLASLLNGGSSRHLPTRTPRPGGLVAGTPPIGAKKPRAGSQLLAHRGHGQSKPAGQQQAPAVTQQVTSYGPAVPVNTYAPAAGSQASSAASPESSSPTTYAVPTENSTQSGNQPSGAGHTGGSGQSGGGGSSAAPAGPVGAGAPFGPGHLG